MKKSKIYLQMLLSYLGILLIPILISSLLYVSIGNVIQSQTKKLNDNLLDMVQKELDQKAEEIIKISSRLAMDTKVQKASRIRNKFQTEDQIVLYDIYKDLNNLNVSEDFIQDVFIYFKNTDMVCSIKGNMSADLYYHLYYENSQFSQEEFYDYVGQVHYADSIILKRPYGGNILFFTMSDFTVDLNNAAATVCIAVKEADIERIMDTIVWDEQMGIFLVDENNAVIGTQNPDRIKSFSYASLIPEQSRKHEVGYQKDLISVCQSVSMPWKYVTVIPSAIMEKEMLLIRGWSAAGLFFCLIIGFFISYYLTKRNYNPIRSMMDLFQTYRSDEIGDVENEYQWLSGQMDRFFKEQVDAERILRNSRKNLKQYYLTQLIQYNYDESLDKIQQYGICLNQSYHMVAIFILKNQIQNPMMECKDKVEENGLQKFILMNILEEVLGDYFNIELAEMGERVSAVIGNNTLQEETIELMKEKVAYVQQIVETQFGFGLCVLFGPFCEGMEGIHTSFLKAIDLEDYINLLDTDMVIFDEVRDIQPQYNYSAEAEQRIINAMKVGDGKKAKESIATVFQNNFEVPISSSVCKCLIFDMIGTLLKGANAGGYPGAAKDIDFDTGFSVKASRMELERNFYDATDQICSHILKNQSELVGDRSFSLKVESYIQENYGNPDLNISITSQNFNITPTYLSSVYKKQTGNSLLDFINAVRLDAAEKYLEDGYSVVEAAAISGFRDSGTFIRIFKKKRGITPGQLKKKGDKV